MHVEIKVAQNFVLNFLFNKLPRRRVNLFGEELELALRDKFADHWYPDKPFKGSAFRCLKITDPSDPVLNRAARESGNPISDIVEHLPTDLAIWIDPGEVSYRIGEKGSVKILYSESDNFGPSHHSTMPSSGHNTLMPMLPGNNQPEDSLEPTNNMASGSSYLPLDNLNAALGSLNIGGGPQAPPNTLSAGLGHGSGHLINHNNMNHSNGPMGGNPVTGGGGGGGPNSVSPLPNQSQQQGGGGSAGQSGSSGNFASFTPRQHQPVTYTAGTFAQTKFGSTKLKSNGKKTNRMSPTEFSNYIKQRAMQKQTCSMGNGLMMNHAGNMQVMNPGGHGFRPGGGNSPRTMSSQMSLNGFYSNGQSAGNGFGNHSNSNSSVIGGGRMSSNHPGAGHGSSQQTSPGRDPFFYPLFPDRQPQHQSPSGNVQENVQGGQNSFSMLNIAPPSSSGGHSPGVYASGSSSGSSSAGSTASSGSSNPWSYVDTDTDAFLNDILNVGLSGKQGSGINAGVNSSGLLYGDFASNTDDLTNSGGSGQTLGTGSSNSFGLGSPMGSRSDGGSLSFGLGKGFGSLGNFGSSGGLSANLGLLRGHGSSPLGQEDSLETGNKSMAPGGPGGGSNSSSGGDKYGQQRVLVAN